jgi:hypothetical protein
MIKFDLERALAGDQLITRSGRDVKNFKSNSYYWFKSNSYYWAEIYSDTSTEIYSYTSQGEYWGGYQEDEKDLFMKYEEKKTMLNILTMQGKSISISPDSSITVLRKFTSYPHWGWWVLWLLVAWPVIIALAFMGKETYIVSVDGVTVDFDLVTYNILMQFISGKL